MTVQQQRRASFSLSVCIVYLRKQHEYARCTCALVYVPPLDVSMSGNACGFTIRSLLGEDGRSAGVEIEHTFEATTTTPRQYPIFSFHRFSSLSLTEPANVCGRMWIGVSQALQRKHTTTNPSTIQPNRPSVHAAAVCFCCSATLRGENVFEKDRARRVKRRKSDVCSSMQRRKLI